MMSVPTVHKKRCAYWIEGISPREARGLTKSLSVFDFLSKRYTARLYEYDDELDIIKVPKGIDYEYLIKKLRSDNLPLINEKDEEYVYIKPREVEFDVGDLSPRDEYQKKALEFITDRSPSNLLTLDTGFGKTIVAILAVHQLRKAAIVISDNMSDQWMERIDENTKCFGGREIIEVRGSDSIEALMRKKKHEGIFYVATTATLTMLHKRDPEGLQKLFSLLGIGIKIFDEAHTFFVQNSIIDMNTQVEKTIYLTASPRRSASNENRIYRRIMAKIPVYGFQTHNLVKHNVVYVNYDTNPPLSVERWCNTNRGFNINRYFEHVFRNNKSAILLYKIVSYFLKKIYKDDPECKTVIYLHRLQDIEDFYYLLKSDPDLPDEIGLYCSLVKDKTKPKELNNKIILTTIKSAGKGMDLKGLRSSFAIPTFTSTVIGQQLIGRLRPLEGKETYYFDFCDRGFKSCIKQRNKRKSYLSKKSKSETIISIDRGGNVEYHKTK